jgi:hypothetical protein
MEYDNILLIDLLQAPEFPFKSISDMVLQLVLYQKANAKLSRNRIFWSPKQSTFARKGASLRVLFLPYFSWRPRFNPLQSQKKRMKFLEVVIAEGISTRRSIAVPVNGGVSDFVALVG